MNTYKDKYIKYKKKYIEIKYRMKGGTISCPICTFNNKDGIKKCDMCGADLKQKQDFPGKLLIDMFLQKKNKNIALAQVQFKNFIHDNLKSSSFILEMKTTETKRLLGYINTELGPEYENIYNLALLEFVANKSTKDAKTKPKHQREEKKSTRVEDIKTIFNISLYNHDGSIVFIYSNENTPDYDVITTYLQSKRIEILDSTDKKYKIIYTKEYTQEEAEKTGRPLINGERDVGISNKKFLQDFNTFTINNKTYTIKINKNSVGKNNNLLNFVDDETKKEINKYL